MGFSRVASPLLFFPPIPVGEAIVEANALGRNGADEWTLASTARQELGLNLIRVLRPMIRRWSRDPLPGLAAVVAMALGIGLTASMLAILDAVLLRELPFEDGDQILHVSNARLEDGRPRGGGMRLSQFDFHDLRAEQTYFEDLVGFYDGTVNLSGDELPERRQGVWVTAGFLELLRVEPMLGRGLDPDDFAVGATRVMLISHRLWQRRYGGGEDVIGQVVRANSIPATVVGVLPEGFRYPSDHDVWLPLAKPTGARDESRARLQVLARLADGASLAQAEQEMRGLADRLATRYPAADEGLTLVVKPFADVMVDPGTRRLVKLMWTAVLCVLLLACFNVSHLLIGRASAQGREMAVRAALGSRRRHAVGRIFLDALFVSLVGAGCGLILARFGVRAFDRAIQTTQPPYWMNVYLSPRVFLGVAACTLAAALVSALVPAWQASRLPVRAVLADGARSSTSFRMGRLGRLMVIVQVAVSTALTLAAGLAIRGVVEAQTYEHAFDGERLLSARLGLFAGDYPEDADRLAFFERLEGALRRRADVEAVGLGTVLPTEMAIGAGQRHYERPGETYRHDGERPRSRWVEISPTYFDTLGVSTLEGRLFNTGDHGEARKVALVNRSFAEREWPGESPIGRTVDFWMGDAEEEADGAAGRLEVVGVVPDLRFAEFDNADDQHGVYVPLAQHPVRFIWIMVRGRVEPAGLMEPLRREVQALDPNLPLYYVRTQDEVLKETLFMPQLVGILFSLFGLSALLLACAGLYGLTAFTVSRRLPEIGVRMALGADPGRIRWLVLGSGLKQTLLGLALGLLLGAGLGFFMASIFFRVTPLDPATFVAVPLLLLVVSLAACLRPAKRAARVDPMRVLNAD